MKHKKRLVGKMLGVSPQKVKFYPEALTDIQKAITRSDMRGLLAVKKIVVDQGQGHSRGKARLLALQKRKGRRKGSGSRKSNPHARLPKKDRWKFRVRVQRNFLRLLRSKNIITPQQCRNFYLRSKGGYFRNLRHLKLYLQEQGIFSAESHKTEGGRQ